MHAAMQRRAREARSAAAQAAAYACALRRYSEAPLPPEAVWLFKEVNEQPCLAPIFRHINAARLLAGLEFRREDMGSCPSLLSVDIPAPFSLPRPPSIRSALLAYKLL